MVSQKVKNTAKKIEEMEIRGAGKIGRAAARALKEEAKEISVDEASDFLRKINKAGKILKDTRPTAVSLSNAIRYIEKDLKELAEEKNLNELKNHLKSRADKFIQNSKRATKKIGKIGSRRISDGDTIMTHCNSSNALAVIKNAHEKGREIEVLATEARPRHQGHITARELSEDNIPVTLIVDSAARYFMKEVDKVIVGADSISANGAVVNKIGTSQIALSAHEARVTTFVAAESYKFHPSTIVGELIKIEERDPAEVIDPEELPKVKIRNPAFDVTPSEYIDLIITERGIIPPEAAYEILQEQFELGLDEDKGIY
ncbi:MAG: ribose 1,5-bisphosphate isomerase [Candidatus Hadarchaeota archaeon]